MEKINPKELDDILRSTPFVILDFTSPGCAPCKKIAQALPGLLADLQAGLQTARVAAYEVDVAAAAPLAARFFVLGVPTLILFKAGKEIKRFNSLPKADTLLSLLS